MVFARPLHSRRHWPQPQAAWGAGAAASMLTIPRPDLRTRIQRLLQRVGGRYWFPQVPLALLLALGGAWLLQVELGAQWQHVLDLLLVGDHTRSKDLLPPLLIGTGMLVMAFGLLFRSRLAWTMALLLAATAAASMLFGRAAQGSLLAGYFLLMVALLAFAWRQFDRASVTASTLFALTSVAMLVMYATFGAYYIGNEFKPEIADLVSALYFAMVTMTTVGYGDITPQTPEARLFTVSIIVLGVAVFATSLTAVIAPLVSRSLQRIVNHKGQRMQRENHFVVVGNAALALNTCRELARRGQPVTRVLRQEPETALPAEVDALVGDPADSDLLRRAGADKAQAVLAMLADDSENAFLVLAVRALGGRARTVAAVNDAKHLERMQLVHPDVVIAPQILGGELAAMMLTGEQVTGDFVLKRLLQAADAGASTPPAG